MTTIQINLPDELAENAAQAGLLSAEAIEKLLRDRLKDQGVSELFMAIDRMSVVDEPAMMTPEEVAQEIAAMRAERRALSSKG